MPTFISKDGVWHPAKEKVGLVNLSGKTKTVNGIKIKPGDPYIYEGPDRASLFRLYEEKTETLGMNFKQDPEFINRVRQLGFTMEDYLQSVGYDEAKVEAEFKKKAAVVTKHEIGQQVKAIETLGGGVDTSGIGKNRYGGFGEIPRE